MILALAFPGLDVDADVVHSVASIAVMDQTFVGLTMDVSVVSLMLVASVGLTGHETEPGVGAVLAEELMMVRPFMFMSCVCVNQSSVSCLTYFTSS